jgi:hypothetical protein
VSRDVFVQDIPVGARSATDIEDGWKPTPLPFGRARVIEAITDLVPSADFAQPSWGGLDLPGAAIEVNIGDDEPLASFALHVRETEPGAADAFIKQLLTTLGVNAFDSAAEGGIFVRP